jgi:hypothetical protein
MLSMNLAILVDFDFGLMAKTGSDLFSHFVNFF